MLELAPVGEAGQGIVPRLMRELRGEAAIVGDVVENEHGADGRAVAIADRRRRGVDADFTAVAANKDRVAAELDAPPFPRAA